jgi:hypothetical protein
VTTQVRSRAPVGAARISIHDLVAGETLDAAWTLYHAAFAELNALAVQRHLMYRHEFDEVMADPRVQKYLAYGDDGRLLGLSVYTNDLWAWPLVSPAYFERRWPQLYAESKIWYCGFVAADRNAGHNTAFADLVEAMCLTAADVGGIIMLDFCRFNDVSHHMSRVVRLMLHRLTGDVRAERADEQNFWLYEFPSGVTT